MTIARMVSMWPWPDGYFANRTPSSKRKKRSLDDMRDDDAVAEDAHISLSGEARGLGPQEEISFNGSGSLDGMPFV